MRASPNDRAFNDALRTEITGATTSTRVLFYDTDNQIREAVYEREFHAGVLQQVRRRLEDAGVLKAVVHITHAIGSSSNLGTRRVSVEYLPTEAFYVSQYQPPRMVWTNRDDQIAQAEETIQQLFEEGGETE